MFSTDMHRNKGNSHELKGGEGCLKQLAGVADEHEAGFCSWSFPEAGLGWGRVGSSHGLQAALLFSACLPAP